MMINYRQAGLFGRKLPAVVQNRNGGILPLPGETTACLKAKNHHVENDVQASRLFRVDSTIRCGTARMGLSGYGNSDPGGSGLISSGRHEEPLITASCSHQQ